MPEHFQTMGGDGLKSLNAISEQVYSDPLKALRIFKQKTGFQFARDGSGNHWRKDFFDHILKSENAVPRHVRYILANPVRAGLVEGWKEYRWRGSTLYDLDSWDVI